MQQIFHLSVLKCTASVTYTVNNTSFSLNFSVILDIKKKKKKICNLIWIIFIFIAELKNLLMVPTRKLVRSVY